MYTTARLALALVLSALCITAVFIGCSPRSQRKIDEPLHAMLVWRQQHHGDVSFVAFSPDLAMLATAAGSGNVVFWDARSGRALRAIQGIEGSVVSAVLSADGKVLATAGPGGVPSLWDVRSSHCVRSMGVAKDSEAVALSSDGSLLISGTSSIYACDVPKGQIKKILSLGVGGDFAEEICLSPNGRLLAVLIYRFSDDDNRQLVVYDMHTRSRLWAVGESRATSPCFSPDGRRLAAIRPGRGIRMYDAYTGKDLGCDEGWGNIGYPCTVAFSQDGRLLASGGIFVARKIVSHGQRRLDGMVVVSDSRTGRRLCSIHISNRPVRAVAFSPDGRLLAAGCSRGDILVWRLEN